MCKGGGDVMSARAPKLSYDSTDLNANNFSVDQELFLREIKEEPKDSGDETLSEEFEFETVTIKREPSFGDDTGASRADEDVFTCADCGFSFKRKDHLLRHLITHGLAPPYACRHCSKTFNRNDVLLKHSAMVHGSTTGQPWSPFSCDVCHKTFKRFDSVRRHKRSHNEERDFVCHLCEMRFTQTSILTRHIRSHTKEAPFRCDVCNKRYTRKYILAKHVVSKHTTQNTCHPCNTCGKEFRSGWILKRHMKTMHKAVQTV